MDKLAEEILDNTTYGSMYEIMEREELIKAMQQYHEAKLKEELPKELFKFFSVLHPNNENGEYIVDTYMERKINNNDTL